jgi:hypothetical protein
MLEQRVKPRFSFQQPVVIRVRSESGWREFQGITQNASAVGVFFITYSLIPVGSDVDLTVAMPHDVRVSAHGKVVRVEPRADEGKIGIAVQCSAPFDELLVSRNVQ